MPIILGHYSSKIKNLFLNVWPLYSFMYLHLPSTRHATKPNGIGHLKHHFLFLKQKNAKNLILISKKQKLSMSDM